MLEIWLLYKYRRRSCEHCSKPCMTCISFSLSHSCSRPGQPCRPSIQLTAWDNELVLLLCSASWYNPSNNSVLLIPAGISSGCADEETSACNTSAADRHSQGLTADTQQAQAANSVLALGRLKRNISILTIGTSCSTTSLSDSS